MNTPQPIYSFPIPTQVGPFPVLNHAYDPYADVLCLYLAPTQECDEYRRDKVIFRFARNTTTLVSVSIREYRKLAQLLQENGYFGDIGLALSYGEPR